MARAGSPLGCGRHTAVVIDNRTGHKLLEVPKPTRVEWTRVRNDKSWAEVDFSSCEGDLSGVWPWRHDLIVYRDGRQVWQGPITQPVASGTATIHADDRWAWLDVRAIRVDLTATGDLTDIALAIIQEGLRHPDGAPDETGILTDPQPDVRPTGVTGTREYEQYRYMAGAALRRLVGGALNVTWVGKLLVMWGIQTLGRVNMLQDKDFLQPLGVMRDGYSAASAVAVLGQDGAVAYVGRTDPYFGLIESVINDRSITDAGSADDLARLQVGRGMPVPVFISVGEEATLSDRAPVSIEELIPGVEVPIWTTVTGFPVYEDLVLERLHVTETAGQEDAGEKVAIVLGRKDELGGSQISGVSSE